MRSYLSFGGGVQSTTLAFLVLTRHPELLAAAKADGTELPEVLIFADTQDEPSEVYSHVEWVRLVVRSQGLTFLTVSHGCLSEDILARADTERQSGVQMTPMWIAGEKQKRAHALRRRCTDTFKVVQLERAAKKAFGINLRKKHWGEKIGTWMGISLDEASRMRTSKHKWSENIYPLLTMRWTRERCEEWLRDELAIVAPRSACWHCPFHSDAEWQRVKAGPEWGQAVSFERRLRSIYAERGLCGLRSEPFLHRKRVPIDAVDLGDPDDASIWDNECAGICGV